MAEQVAEKTVEETIREEILTEKGLPKGEKKPWEARLEADHPELAIAPKTKSKAETSKEEEPKEKVEEEPKEEPKPDSEQPVEEEAKPAEGQPAESETKPEAAKEDTAKEEAYLADYAKRKQIPIEQAKEEVSRNKTILAKYNGDAVELANAYHLSQQEFNKLKAEQQKQLQVADPVIQQVMANPKAYVADFVKTNAAKLIEEYRANNPAKSRDMDDEQVLEEQRDKGLGILQAKMEAYQTNIKVGAAKRREEFISSIAEADRQFIPEIKIVLDKLPDFQVASSNFDFKDLVRWAKGGADIDKVKKSEFDRGYKAGLEKAKILGEVGHSAPTGKVKQKTISQAGEGLTNYQKEQARQMFGQVYDNEEEMFKAYKEVNQSRKK